MNNIAQNQAATIGLVNRLKKDIPNCTIILDLNSEEMVVGYTAVNMDGQMEYYPKKGSTVLTINGIRSEHELKINEKENIVRKEHLKDIKKFKQYQEDNKIFTWFLFAAALSELIYIIIK